MLMQIKTWDKIREHFSEQEKATLNAAICGETICPRGVTLDEEKLGRELAQKIQKLKSEA